MAKQSKKAQAKVRKVMHEWKEGELHSGSKKGAVVSSQKQAVAIALRSVGVPRKKSSHGRRMKVGKK